MQNSTKSLLYNIEEIFTQLHDNFVTKEGTLTRMVRVSETDERQQRLMK